ncbi:hypothetical protein LJR220_001775 [Bradyrhizobium sp. LjRoot220]|uniref:hypothetical protein n=1 Tax=Bradyrhizobium sp. LjRoot220 TaxID=3342284 RepID=UPI003ED05DE2
MKFAVLVLTLIAATTVSYSAHSQSTTSALTDLEIEMVPTQRDPSINAVYLKNKNTGSSVIGALSATGDKNFRVETLQRATSRNVFPQQFEVRVPPGQKQYIGTDRIKHALPQLGIEQIKVTYNLDGARYVATEPYPVPAPGALFDNVFAYEIAYSNGYVTILINLNHVFGVEYDLDPLPGSVPDAGVRQGLMPMESKLAYQGGGEMRHPAWRVINARFFLVDDAKLRLHDW